MAPAIPTIPQTAVIPMLKLPTAPEALVVAAAEEEAAAEEDATTEEAEDEIELIAEEARIEAVLIEVDPADADAMTELAMADVTVPLAVCPAQSAVWS